MFLKWLWKGGIFPDSGLRSKYFSTDSPLSGGGEKTKGKCNTWTFHTLLADCKDYISIAGMITCHFANLYLGTYPGYSYTTLHNTHEILASTLFLMNRFLARCLKWGCNHNWTISSYLRFYTFTLPRHQVISFIERSLYFTEPWQKTFREP